MSGGRLRPDEAGEFAGHGGGDDGAAVLARRQPAEPPAQADLRGPGSLDDVRGKTFVAALEFGADARREVIRPGGTDQDGADVTVAGLGDAPALLGGARGVPEGTKPTKPMNLAAVAKRRQSQTSEARPNAPR